MKKINTNLFLFCFLTYLILLVEFKPNRVLRKEWSNIELEEVDEIKSDEELTKKVIKKVTVTKYNPVVSQCDDTPLITADNSKIDMHKLDSGKLKWIAVSRDLRKFFKYGSKVKINSKYKEINGIYWVHDTMNARYSNRIDILSPIGDSKGKWINVEIELLQ